MLRVGRWSFFLCLLLVSPGWYLFEGRAQARTKVQLWLEAEAARPGETVWAGVHLKPPAGWHTYWRNPGESGKATEIRWKFPPGVTAGPVQWPVPETHVADELTTYVYPGEVVLLVPLVLAPDLAQGTLSLEAEVDWLECEIACVPGRARVLAALEVASQRRPGPRADALTAWKARVPLPDPDLKVSARWTEEQQEDKTLLEISGPATEAFVPNDFFGYAAADFEVLPSVRPLAAVPGRFAFGKWVNSWGKPLPAQLAGLLVQRVESGKPLRVVEVTLTPDPATPAKEAKAGPTASADAGQSGGTRAHSFWLLLAFAFLGGMILNIMPCVLPVIALKVLGFVQQSDAAPGRVRFLGLVYALGVLVSFLVLAGLVIAVKTAGGSASWGLQMQNPVFRVVLLSLVTLVALNLFGVFEVFLPGLASQASGSLATKQGATWAFFHGVLATLLATPCTAPFLAVALGFAFTQPAGVLVVFFAAVAVGLAFPYVLLCWYPQWLKLLPKPGPWMLRFKMFLGFPMLATAVWLLDISAAGYGNGGVLWLGLYLVVLSLAAWVWGEYAQRGSTRKGVAALVGLALVSGGYWGILEGQLNWRSPVTIEANQSVKGAVGVSAGTLWWEPWSPEAVLAAQAKGQPVLVDFTAKWCLTCQVNKKVALEADVVRKELQAKEFRLFMADNTNPNPKISAELQRHNRAGVPLVLVYAPATNLPPIVLPEVLTPGIVLEALEKAVPSR